MKWSAILVVIVFLSPLGCSRSDEKTMPLLPKEPRQKHSETRQAPAAGTHAAGSSAGAHSPSMGRAKSIGAAELFIDPENPVTGDRLQAILKFKDDSTIEHAFTYVWLINGEKVQESAAPALGKPVKCDDFVELQVKVAEDESQDPALTRSTFVGNAAPSLRLLNQSLDETGRYQAELEVSDLERDAVQLLLKNSPPGMTINPQLSTVQWSVGPEQQGAFEVSVAARDSRGAETLLSYQIKVSREKSERKEKNEASPSSSQ